jgi:ABC-type uncharacterized transport system ATPase subunit
VGEPAQLPDQENQAESSAERLVQLLDQLTIDQIRFVIARQQFSKDREAADEIGVKPDTVAQWKQRGAPIDEVVRLMVADGLVLAQRIRRNSLAKAMLVKVEGLDVKDERLRQSVATEIIEWEMGTAKQRHEVSGPEDEQVVVRVVKGIEP